MLTNTERGGSARSGGSAAEASSGEPLEYFKYDDAVVRKFVIATAIWGVVAMLVGVIVALELVAPSVTNWEYGGVQPFGFLRFLTNIEFLSFGRLRPLHTNAAIFAFAGNALFGAIYYSTQRLCKARMFSDVLSNLHFWGWQAIIVSAALTLPLGITQGKEYAELEWPIDLAIAVVWVGFFGVNFFGTLARRRERHMYVALWFYIATIVTVAILHVFNNIAVPTRLFKSYSIYAGVQDAFMQWWYGHNAVAFFLTTPFLGLMYYFLPKAAERPVYSYRLSIVHFWSLVFIYIWAGPHHLHYTALPSWASSLGMLFSLMLWMPSWGGMINGLLTLRGAWNKVTADPILKFFVAGITFYGMATFEGPMLSIKTVNSLSHYTDWTIAHVHAGALGWNGLMTFGMIYWLLPRLFQTKVWSQKMVSAHFWVATFGIVLYVIPIYFAGITQGLMWRAFDETGRLQFPSFITTVVALMPMYWMRVLGGTIFLVGACMCLVNVVMTWAASPLVYEEPEHAAPALGRGYSDDPIPESRLTSNIDWARNVDSHVLQGWFHRVWERRPFKFTIMVIIAVAIASLFEIIPTFLIRSNVPTIATVTPYTPLELAGRETYIAEGCYNCHSQMIRPIWAETKRYGEYSKPGEFVYDHPFQWGSRRIGPDLAREGGKQSHDWHIRHLANPRELMPDSIMPGYSHLLRADLDFGLMQKRVDVMAMIGVPYGDAINKAEELARQQADSIASDLIKQGGMEFYFPDGVDGTKLTPEQREPYRVNHKQVIALIAYLQRMGTDISKAPVPDTKAAPETKPAAADAKHAMAKAMVK
jgi:cytochrome c oxidase cbb3-type subunit I/II